MSFNLPSIIGNTQQAATEQIGALSATDQIASLSAGLGKRIVPGVAPGAIKPSVPKVVTNIVDVNGKKLGKDLRVRIKVPPIYLTDKTIGLNNEMSVSNLHGIIFPYTPSINVEYKAEYTSQTPLHTNFPINFYQKSSIGSISIAGKFSVSNSDDAAMYIATVHLLKALTKMRSGGARSGDFDSGAPPPVCRLFAHGEWMFNNVPVAITNFRVELPDSIDYFTMPKNSVYGTTSVPVMSTISITCLPMYSRNEMQRFNVTDYLSNNNGFNKQGYL